MIEAGSSEPSYPGTKSPFPSWDMERKDDFPGRFSEENGAQLPALPLTCVAVGRSFNLSIPQLLFEPREAIALQVDWEDGCFPVVLRPC